MEERIFGNVSFSSSLKAPHGGPRLKTKLNILVFGHQKPGSEATVSVLNLAGEGLRG
jgi:hypothetical protein